MVESLCSYHRRVLDERYDVVGGWWWSTVCKGWSFGWPGRVVLS